MDDSKSPKYFDLKASPEVNTIRMDSSTSSKIAVVSEGTFITKWSTVVGVRFSPIISLFNHGGLPVSRECR